MTLGAACEPAYLSGQTGNAGGAGAYEIGGDGIGYNGALTTGANRYQAGTIASINFSPGSGGAGYIGGGGGGNSSASGGGGSGGGGSSYIDSGATGTSFGVANNGGYREGSSMQNAGNGLIEIYSAAMAPTISSIAAGDSMATVTYVAPTENGGGVITNYKYSIDGSVWTAIQPASTSGTFTIPNLTNGTTYDVRVRAVNAYGDGVPSSPTSVTPALPNLNPVSPGSNPNIPSSGVPLGQSVFLIDGQLSSVTVSPDSQSDPTALQIAGTGFTMELKGLGANGQPLGLDSTGALILESDRTAHVEGTGFKPNSDVEVYLFSNPRHVGTVRTDNSGNFNGNLAIPNDVPAGRHTLQSNGFSTTGQVRSLSLGVRLNENSELASTGFNLMTPLSLAVMMLTAGLVLANSPYFRKRKSR